MLRLVMGLGTWAVDCAQGFYPRLVNLDRPQMTTAVTSKEKHQFFQRRIDVIDTEKGLVEGKDLSWLERELSPHLKRVLLEHDWDAETDFQNRGQNREIYFVSCEGLAKNDELMTDMRSLMALI